MARARRSTPAKLSDARSQRSIAAMRAALLSLIEQHALDEISIRDITAAAGVSYPTFFRHYASRTAVVEDIATQEVRQVLALGLEAFRQTGTAEALCRYVHAHRKLWTVLLNGGATDAMRREFTRIGLASAADGPRFAPWLPLELAAPFITSGIFEILAWWLRQPNDYPLVEIARLFDALIVRPILDPPRER